MHSRCGIFVFLRSSTFALLGICMPVLSGCKAMTGRVEAGGRMPFEVSQEERERALALLAEAETFRQLTADAQTYLIDVEVFRDKGAETGRQVLVTHYRTEGDLAILSRVDLVAENVVGVESVAHLPVPLSEEEYEIARRMALEDAEVGAALRGLDVEVEAQVSRTFLEDDPQFGHRVVHLLFKTPRGYQESPAVIVDLTTGTVTVE